MDYPKVEVDVDRIQEMLFDDKEYIKEFAEAGIDSFDEFIRHYRLYLLDRDETNLRKAGHKIKPVAQMIGVDQIVDEYENAKELLHGEKPDKDLRHSVDLMDAMVKQVKEDLQDLS